MTTEGRTKQNLQKETNCNMQHIGPQTSFPKY
jgi:hypothetical protein